MNPALKNAAKLTTHCRLCHKAVAESSVLDVPLIGAPDKKVFDYLGVLSKHLQKHHPDQAKTLAGSVQEVTALMLYTCFEGPDESMNNRAELARQIFINQLAPVTTDDALQDTVARFGLDETQANLVYEVMKSFRDALTFRGQFAPQAREEKKVQLVRP